MNKGKKAADAARKLVLATYNLFFNSARISGASPEVQIPLSSLIPDTTTNGILVVQAAMSHLAGATVLASPSVLRTSLEKNWFTLRECNHRMLRAVEHGKQMLVHTRSCPLHAVHYMLSTTFCPLYRVHYLMSTTCCPQQVVHYMLSTTCCPLHVFDGMVSPTKCTRTRCSCVCHVLGGSSMWCQVPYYKEDMSTHLDHEDPFGSSSAGWCQRGTVFSLSGMWIH
jgi:hypothetical protein